MTSPVGSHCARSRHWPVARKQTFTGSGFLVDRGGDPNRPQVLIPFDRREALTAAQAAKTAGNAERTIRLWCEVHNIGRKVGGGLRVSRVALTIFLDGDEDALRAYLAGDRRSPRVAEYFRRV